MSPRLRHALACLAIVPLSSLLTVGGCAKPPDPKSKLRPPPHVIVKKVEVRDVDLEVRAPVDLRAVLQTDVYSKTLGYVDAVLVDRGDRVRRGQTVALVRPSDLPDQLAAARGSLLQVQATLAMARTSVERNQKLAPAGLVSQQELDQSRASLASAEASQAAVQSQVAALATRLGETRLVAPIDGVVLTRRLDPGALVGQAGAGSLLTIGEVDQLRVFIAVGERQSVDLRVGQEAYVNVDALPDKRFSGKVVRIAPGFDAATRTLEAEVRIDNKSGVLRPGMYGRGAILVGRHAGAIVLPVSAVQIIDDKAIVFVLDGEVVRRKVVKVGFDGGDWLEITEGVAPGSEVVIAGLEALSDGTKVRVERGVDPFNGTKGPSK